jgi:hypothetical protein
MGFRFHILGHELSFSFRTITEKEMIVHFQLMPGRHLKSSEIQGG